jgi:hypothetical protein
VLVGDLVAVCRCLAHIHHDHVFSRCHCGADRYAMGMPMIRSCLALAMEALVVGGRRSELGGVGGPHGHRIVIARLPRLTCIREALRLEVAAGTVGVGSLVKALGVGYLNATSGRGCCCGSGFGLFREALGRRLRWVVTGCSFAVPVRGGCVMIATGSIGHWRVGARAGHCCADQ